jgi:hypothetical protein
MQGRSTDTCTGMYRMMLPDLSYCGFYNTQKYE